MSIYNSKQEKLAKRIDDQAESSLWKNWKWQLKNRIRDISTFEELLGIEFANEEKKQLEKTLLKFPLSITPYYLSLIDENDFRNDPIFKQSFPNSEELTMYGHDMKDPLAEDKDSPVTSITHRYPDRVLFHISNLCSMYCRHCTRKRKVGEIDHIPDKKVIEGGIAYIRETPAIRDVFAFGRRPADAARRAA